MPITRESLPKKIIKATIVPINMAIPPNLGMGFVCILLASLGISTAPILGASHMATGVKRSDNINAVKNGSKKFIVLPYCSPNITILSPASPNISMDS